MTVTAYADPTRDTAYRTTARSAQELGDWLAWLELGGFASCDAYERTVGDLLNKYPDVPFDGFTDGHVMALLQGYPRKSQRIRKAHLNNWFSWGYRTRRLPANPVDLLPTIKRTPQPIIDVFTETEQAALESLPGPDGPLMTLLFEAGLRKREACYMRVERIDFRIGKVIVKEGAKYGRDRLVPIVPNLAGRMDHLISTEPLKPSDYLWYDKPGGGFATKLRRSKPIGETSFHRWWVRCLEAAEVEYRKPHTTRHTFATRWRARGLELDDLQQILGHSSVSTTSDLYVHTSSDDIGVRMLALVGDKS